MLQTIERNQIRSALKRIGGIAAAVAAAAIAVAAVWPEVSGWLSQKSIASGSCSPGDLDCLDDRYYEETGFPFSHGEPDGCSLDSVEEQLQSPLCYPHVAADPTTCPPLDEAVDACCSEVEGSDPEDGESLPGGVEEPEEPASPKTPAPSRDTYPFEDVGAELPG